MATTEIPVGDPTELQLQEFAQLMFLGVPSMMAFWYLFPHLTSHDFVATTSARWSRLPEVRDALNELRDDPIHQENTELVSTAYNKAMREMSWFLLSFEFAALDGHGYDQYMDALKVLRLKAEPLSSEELAGNVRALNDFIERQQRALEDSTTVPEKEPKNKATKK